MTVDYKVYKEGILNFDKVDRNIINDALGLLADISQEMEDEGFDLLCTNDMELSRGSLEEFMSILEGLLQESKLVTDTDMSQ